MTAPTLRQLRAWERRAATLERQASILLSDMMDVVGVEYEAAGENFTNQADDTAASAQNLLNYIGFCARLAKEKRLK